MWSCPECGRPFGRKGQSHECAPGLTLDAFLAEQPPAHRKIYRRAIGFLKKLGPLTIEPVGVGIFVKRRGGFCQLRAKHDGVELIFKLGRKTKHPRIRRVVQASANRFGHYIRLHDASELDDEIREWIAEAYLDAPT